LLIKVQVEHRVGLGHAEHAQNLMTGTRDHQTAISSVDFLVECCQGPHSGGIDRLDSSEIKNNPARFLRDHSCAQGIGALVENQPAYTAQAHELTHILHLNRKSHEMYLHFPYEWSH
jgi:hypothetical protein